MLELFKMALSRGLSTNFSILSCSSLERKSPFGSRILAVTLPVSSVSTKTEY
jgi:hypothetical protein